MSSPYTSIAGALLPKGLPDDAVPFAAVNATDITTTTKQTIKTATAGKRMFITQASCYNKTTIEDQILMLRHGTTDIAILHPVDIADSHGRAPLVRTFDPPLVIPTGVDLDGIGVIALVGDCVIDVNGYIGT
jgi:hypothetical protein